MNCENVLKLLNSHIDKELDVNKRKAIETHVATCDNCRSQLKSLETTILAMRDLEEIAVPTKVSKALREIAGSNETSRIDKAKENVFSRLRLTPSFIRYVIAASAVAAIIIVIAVSQYMTDTSELTFHGKIEQKELDKNKVLSTRPAAKETAEKNAIDEAATNNVTNDNEATDKEPALFGSSTQSYAPTTADWPEVLASAKNYDRTSGEILLNDIAGKTKGLYTVNDVAQRRVEIVDNVIEKISAKDGDGEVMRKPLDALLDETEREALPVYMEKAKFKGTDCWMIIIRWGYGNSANKLDKTSLYITDLTGWKTLYYRSQ